MMMIKVMPSWIFLIVLVACIISPRRVLADFPNVPLIDVGRWISSSGSSSSSETTTDSVDPSSSLLLEQQRIVNEILEACKSVGFFTIINHGIDTTVIQEAWKASAEFFNLSIEEKMNHNANGDDAEYPYGYEQKEQLSKGKALDGDSNGGDESSMMMNTDDDIPILESKETYAIGPNNIQSGMPLRRWVNTPSVPTFRIALETYYEQMESLALRLLQLFALALGQPISYFESKMDHHMSALRLIHYYPLNDTSTEEPKRRVIRAGAHTDYGALTILNAGQPGLQVLRRDLENQNRTEWYSVPLVPNAFVINLGDLMQRWTNGTSLYVCLSLFF